MSPLSGGDFDAGTSRLPDAEEDTTPAETTSRLLGPSLPSDAILESAASAFPVKGTTYRDRLGAATPLLVVSVGCFVMGVYLRWTANVGPAPALPIWTLFFALGLVAGLGGGFFLVIEPDEEAIVVPAAFRRPTPSRAGPARARSPLGHSAHPVPRGNSAPVAPVIEGTPDLDVLAPSTATGAADADVSPAVPAREMLAELDRVISDLRPARLNRPQL